MLFVITRSVNKKPLHGDSADDDRSPGDDAAVIGEKMIGTLQQRLTGKNGNISDGQWAASILKLRQFHGQICHLAK